MPQSLQRVRSRQCSQRPLPPQSLHLLRRLPCGQAMALNLVMTHPMTLRASRDERFIPSALSKATLR
eukprot:scaffold45699_cov75-Phaeocystis_antarctica.AAC.4